MSVSVAEYILSRVSEDPVDLSLIEESQKQKTMLHISEKQNAILHYTQRQRVEAFAILPRVASNVDEDHGWTQYRDRSC
jgi:hypothetical protein